jgi:hypothetical protein
MGQVQLNKNIRNIKIKSQTHPRLAKNSFVLEKGFEPKNPRYDESGKGWVL